MPTQLSVPSIQYYGTLGLGILVIYGLPVTLLKSIERASGVFRVTVTEDGSCDGTDTINLTQIYVQELVALQTSASACASLEIGTSNSFASYSWSKGSADTAITVQISGTYTVTAASVEGCEKVDEITVEVLEATENNLGNDTTMCSDESWSLSLSAASSGVYLWQDTSTSSFYTVVNSPGMYWLLITADNGCPSLDSIEIDEKKCTVGIADQRADELFIYPNPASTEVLVTGLNSLSIVTILDRTGRIIQAEKEIANDGVIGLQNLSVGVYFMEIKTKTLTQVQRLLVVH